MDRDTKLHAPSDLKLHVGKTALSQAMAKALTGMAPGSIDLSMPQGEALNTSLSPLPVTAPPAPVPPPSTPRVGYPAQAILRVGAAFEAWVGTLSSDERMAADDPKVVAGILTDLRHFCDDRGLDFTALIEKASEQHQKGIGRRAIEIPRWQEEFPDATEMPDLPAGFDDLSWHNDVNPSYGIVVAGAPVVCIAIDEPGEQRMADALGSAEAMGEPQGRFRVLAFDGPALREVVATNDWGLAVKSAKGTALNAIADTFVRVEARWYPVNYVNLQPNEIPASDDAANVLGREALLTLARLVEGVDPEDWTPTFGDLSKVARDAGRALLAPKAIKKPIS